MAKKDTLFRLIHTLTKAEKGYIVRKVMGNKDSQTSFYLELFQIIVHLPTYDVEKIVRKQPRYHNKQILANHKNYLTQFILKSLASFHRKQTPILDVYELIGEVYVLFEKGLMEDARRLIHKGQRLATKFGYEIPLLELNLLERRVIRRSKIRKDKAYHEMKKLQHWSGDLTEHISGRIKMLDLYEDLSFAKGKEREGIWEQIEKETTWENTDDKQSIELTLHYHLLQARYCETKIRQTTDPIDRKTFNENHGFHLKRLVDFFEAHTHILKDSQYKIRYLGCINNYFNWLFSNEKKEGEFLEQINKLEGLKFESQELIGEQEYFICHFKLIYHLTHRQYVEASKMKEQVEAVIGKVSGNKAVNRKFALLINLAIAFFLHEDFSAAREKINEIISEPKPNIQVNVQFFARLIEIMIFIEKEDYEMTDYRIISAKHFYDQYVTNKEDAKLVREMFKAFKNVANTYDRGFLRPLLDKLKGQARYKEVYFWIEKLVGKRE